MIRTLPPDEILPTLMGRQLVEWGQDEEAVHLTLDDGRVLVFVGLGIVTPGDRTPLQ